MLAASLIGALWARSGSIEENPHESMHVESDLTKLRLSQTEIDLFPEDVRHAIDEAMDPCDDFYQFAWYV